MWYLCHVVLIFGMQNLLFFLFLLSTSLTLVSSFYDTTSHLYVSSLLFPFFFISLFSFFIPLATLRRQFLILHIFHLLFVKSCHLLSLSISLFDDDLYRLDLDRAGYGRRDIWSLLARTPPEDHWLERKNKTLKEMRWIFYLLPYACSATYETEGIKL